MNANPNFVLSVNAASITRLAITYQLANSKDVSWKVYHESLWV